MPLRKTYMNVCTMYIVHVCVHIKHHVIKHDNFSFILSSDVIQGKCYFYRFEEYTNVNDVWVRILSRVRNDDNRMGKY